MSAITASDRMPITKQPGADVSQARVLRSEWIKRRSLRSIRWSLAFGLLGMLLGIVVAAFDMGRWSQLPLDSQQHYKSVGTALIGWHLPELAIGVLGVLVITGEYSTGMIRNSAGAIATFAGIIFVLPGLVGVLSNSLKNSINPYLPSNAASAFFTTKPDLSDHVLHHGSASRCSAVTRRCCWRARRCCSSAETSEQ